MQLILAIDQGTTGTTALLMTPDGHVVGSASQEFPQYFPHDGWVEHDPLEIWASVCQAVERAIGAAGAARDSIIAIGITNQRETALAWNRRTDAPLHNAIVWQDRRTTQRCLELRDAGHEPEIMRTTGLLVDPYFSCTKLEWLLREAPAIREANRSLDAAVGTVDSYLVWKLAGGSMAGAPHVTDVTNASRTGLMDLLELRWSPRMLELFGVPHAALPRIVPCTGVIAKTMCVPGLPDGIPISGLAGDQQAALFGQACFEVGDAKCTYGTGAFVLAQTGEKIVRSQARLISTVAWMIDGKVNYALEGSAFVAGAAIQWLRDGLGVLDNAAASESIAASVESSEGVVFVPALTGLGAPHWDPEARGQISGITRGTTLAHLVRATLEGIGYQVDDLLQAIGRDLGHPLTRLRVDGGASSNDILMQFQSDISEVPIERPEVLESTARGAAMLAGLGVGLFSSPHQAAQMIRIEKSFKVRMETADRRSRRQQWHHAVRRTSGRANERD